MLSSKNSKEGALRAFGDKVALTERGLLLGGTVLAKMREDSLCIDGEEDRILTLLAVARKGNVNGATLYALRRYQNIGRVVINASPRSILRKAGWASSTRTPPTACHSRPS